MATNSTAPQPPIIYPDEEIMPPDDRLPPESIQILTQWIADGAVWEKIEATVGSTAPASP